MTYLALHNVTKSFKTYTALAGISLGIERGELMCLLGPSGCGKTTTLRIIAGFETADSGAVTIGEDDVTRVPSHKRDIGVVFQDYALFPHLTVAENVGFGLLMRRLPKPEIAAAVESALALVHLTAQAGRYPSQLSGGQQQRVALARAIAIKPRILLLDEPLSNLDAKLRDEMRDEIRRIQRETRITALFVTHDQGEALAMADRIAVMDHGRIVQVDDPVTIYERPRHPFVAGFIGQTTLIRGRVAGRQAGFARLESDLGASLVAMADALPDGSMAFCAVKNERITLSRAVREQSDNVFSVTVTGRTYLGTGISYACELGAQTLNVLQSNLAATESFKPGDTAYASWAAADCHLIPDIR